MGKCALLRGRLGRIAKEGPIRCVAIAMYAVAIATYPFIGVKFLLREDFIGREFAINIGQPVSYSQVTACDACGSLLLYTYVEGPSEYSM